MSFLYLLPLEHKLLESRAFVALFATVVLVLPASSGLRKHLLRECRNDAGGGASMASLVAHPRGDIVIVSPPSGHFCVLRGGGEKGSVCWILTQAESRGHGGQRVAPSAAHIICSCLLAQKGSLPGGSGI